MPSKNESQKELLKAYQWLHENVGASSYNVYMSMDNKTLCFEPKESSNISPNGKSGPGSIRISISELEKIFSN